MNRKTIIIAEAGVNHNGCFDRAVEMVRAAARAGADYVKFQTFRAEALVTAASQTAQYQKANCNAGSQLEMLRGLELPHLKFADLARICREEGVGFLSTPFDAESLVFLSMLGMDYLKVPSGEITDLPFLRQMASSRIPALISTGMSSLGEVEAAVNVFRDAGYCKSDITLLHCNTEYPTPFADVNLRAMLTLRDAFGLQTGYSDHTQGIEVAVAAAALGAVVVEKHFTLSRSLPGPDHAASLEPDELKQMVDAVRNVTQALGSPLKAPSPSERKNMAAARKSIVAACHIAAGETFTEKNLTAKRPGTGLSPMLWDLVIGRTSSRDYEPDDQIEL